MRNDSMLHLKGLTVVETKESDSQYDFTVTVENTVPPCCFDGLVRNGTKTTLFRDLPIHGKHVGILVARQRYLCRGCHKTHYQTVPHMHAKHEMTTRMVEYIQVKAMDRTFSALADELGVSEFVVRGIFRTYAMARLNELEPVTPEWMGLDELYILSQFRGIVTNVKERTLVDMMPNRSKESVIRYLMAIPDKETIKLVTMDMWAPYRDAVHLVLPHARICVDKFHVVRMASDAVERIRKDHRAGLTKKERLRLKDDRWMLLTKYSKLSALRTMVLASVFEEFPLLKQAHTAKEEFRAVWDAGTVEEAKACYDKWEAALPEEIAPAFSDLTRAMKNWREEIFTYFDYRVTNAYTEALNGIARVVNRMGRGYSFEVLRAKMLLTQSAHKLAPNPAYRRGSIFPSGGLLRNRRSRSFGAKLSTLERMLGRMPETR